MSITINEDEAQKIVWLINGGNLNQKKGFKKFKEIKKRVFVDFLGVQELELDQYACLMQSYADGGGFGGNSEEKFGGTFFGVQGVSGDFRGVESRLEASDVTVEVINTPNDENYDPNRGFRRPKKIEKIDHKLDKNKLKEDLVLIFGLLLKSYEVREAIYLKISHKITQLFQQFLDPDNRGICDPKTLKLFLEGYGRSVDDAEISYFINKVSNGKSEDFFELKDFINFLDEQSASTPTPSRSRTLKQSRKPELKRSCSKNGKSGKKKVSLKLSKNKQQSSILLAKKHDNQRLKQKFRTKSREQSRSYQKHDRKGKTQKSNLRQLKGIKSSLKSNNVLNHLQKGPNEGSSEAYFENFGKSQIYQTEPSRLISEPKAHQTGESGYTLDQRATLESSKMNPRSKNWKKRRSKSRKKLSKNWISGTRLRHLDGLSIDKDSESVQKGAQMSLERSKSKSRSKSGSKRSTHKQRDSSPFPHAEICQRPSFDSVGVRRSRKGANFSRFSVSRSASKSRSRTLSKGSSKSNSRSIGSRGRKRTKSRVREAKLLQKIKNLHMQIYEFNTKTGASYDTREALDGENQESGGLTSDQIIKIEGIKHEQKFENFGEKKEKNEDKTGSKSRSRLNQGRLGRRRAQKSRHKSKSHKNIKSKKPKKRSSNSRSRSRSYNKLQKTKKRTPSSLKNAQKTHQKSKIRFQKNSKKSIKHSKNQTENPKEVLQRHLLLFEIYLNQIKTSYHKFELMKYFLVHQDVLLPIYDVLRKKKVGSVDEFVDLIIAMSRSQFSVEQRRCLKNFCIPYFMSSESIHLYLEGRKEVAAGRERSIEGGYLGLGGFGGRNLGGKVDREIGSFKLIEGSLDALGGIDMSIDDSYQSWNERNGQGGSFEGDFRKKLKKSKLAKNRKFGKGRGSKLKPKTCKSIFRAFMLSSTMRGENPRKSTKTKNSKNMTKFDKTDEIIGFADISGGNDDTPGSHTSSFALSSKKFSDTITPGSVVTFRMPDSQELYTTESNDEIELVCREAVSNECQIRTKFIRQRFSPNLVFEFLRADSKLSELDGSAEGLGIDFTSFSGFFERSDDLKMRFSQEQILRIFKRFDKDCDGVISLEDFLEEFQHSKRSRNDFRDLNFYS